MPEDLDNWEEEGCEGWGWQKVLPDFNRLENDLRFGEETYHGADGPIPIYRAPQENWGAVDKALRDAGLALGYGWAEDHNAPDTTGVSPYVINSSNQQRVSANDAYLEPARTRSNLKIQGGALVDRVLFSEDGRRAIGVRVQINGVWQEIFGNQIILSAGSVHSPAILQRSGIGPAPLLNKLGIPIMRELPVGKNWHDHPLLGLVLDLRPEARAESPFARHTNCCIRYSSGLANAGGNDMMMVALNLFGDAIGRHMTPDGGNSITGSLDAPRGMIVVWVN